MKKLYLLTFLLAFCVGLASAQDLDKNQEILNPSEFLGYDLGTTFTWHHQVVAYYMYIAQKSSKTKLVRYGKTYEGRPLVTMFVSSEENIRNLDQIRKNNLISAGFLKENTAGRHIPFVWLSYNIHGNEASGTEAALLFLYQLVTDKSENVKKWLDDLVIVIDPCENPDGRDRYAQWYRQKQQLIPNSSQEGWEHNEPWPGGRFNHYLFDLNRDWLWQTQAETQQRIKHYQDYFPHVHVDLHEMGYNDPYFFAPAAKPYHEDITEWQRKFQQYIGENHAQYFQKNNQLFYTKEVYDLFYPSYGDTYPIFNGAIGFTYEQGGGGRAGAGIQTQTGQILTLKQRLLNHYTTSFSTVEVSYQHREKLLKEFKAYFQPGNNAKEVYKSYIIKFKNQEEKAKALMNLLEKQKITFGNPKSSGLKLTGFDYQNNKENTFTLEKEDIVIQVAQAQSHLIKVIFEPKSKLEDSLTYDATAWALPYIFGTEAYAVREKIAHSDQKPEVTFVNQTPLDTLPYAYLATWKDAQDVRFLAELLKADIKVRLSELPFKIGDNSYQRGTLVINRPDNDKLTGNQLDLKVLQIANEFRKTLVPVQSGLVKEGKDFGSDYMLFIPKPKIALLGGENVSPTDFGELWHYFEQELQYPVTVINADDFNSADLKSYQVVVLADGYNYNKISDRLMSFVSEGGKVVAVGNGAMDIFLHHSRTQLNKQKNKAESESKTKDEGTKNLELLKKYENRERSRLSEGVSGAIYEVSLDESHPLAFGEDKKFFVMKNNSTPYPFLPEGAWNVGVYGKNSHISGFVGAKVKDKIQNTLAIGVESIGRGKVVYFADSPIFRGFWHSGKLLLGNALFLVK